MNASRRAGERTIELEVAFRVRECVLGLLVDCPAKAKLQLMRSLGPRDVIAELVIVRFVDPGRPVCGVVSCPYAEPTGWKGCDCPRSGR